jgi:hypothetical protein
VSLIALNAVECCMNCSMQCLVNMSEDGGLACGAFELLSPVVKRQSDAAKVDAQRHLQPVCVVDSFIAACAAFTYPLRPSLPSLCPALHCSSRASQMRAAPALTSVSAGVRLSFWAHAMRER